MPGMKRFLVEKIDISYNISICLKKYDPYAGNKMLSIRLASAILSYEFASNFNEIYYINMP